ncbi:hypothetical protein F3J20_22530 [Paraburkholderia sp. Cy-641]|uniref:hypothetical protein n=1 Tax=Paraburkholderia sp. Cy-641 TaxID=2608337 RepID=UPI00142086EF|nr:hypothetical protein [Paraburkholderia sp. Cy-641]NIF80134.1 hypothetical protein [Paraburkholderia sp. Cy-641]
MADLPVWPATLPAATANSYGITPGTPYAATDMDSGRSRQRRRFTRVPSTVDVVWAMSRDQYAVFEAFLEYDIGLGTDWFQIELLNGVGVSTVVAQFHGDPPFKHSILDGSPGWHQVTATLKTRRLPVMTADEYGVAKVYPASEIASLSDLLHQLVHVDLPGPMRWF